MAQNNLPKTSRVFFVAGLILVALALVTGPRLLELLSSFLNIALRLDGIEGRARIWVLRLVFVAVGLPLLLYNYRARPRGRVLFDLSIGFTLTVASLFFIEGLFYGLNNLKPASTSKTSVTASEVYVKRDETLGYTLKPDLRVAVTQTQASKVIYQVSYSMDRTGRRVTPVSRAEDRANFILFFGGSFTFGVGVADAETLPAYVGQLAPAYRPYNYGVPGYGTQQLFARLQSDAIVQEIEEPQGIAIYNFICPHINRVVGTSKMQNAWGDLMPYYAVDANDRLVRQGNLISSRPLRAALFAAVEISQTAQYFNLVLPRLNDGHVGLTARLIEEAARAYQRNFGSDDFYVLIYPSSRCAPRLIPHLDQAHVKYLDYSTLLARNDERWWIPDGHPTALAHQRVAEQLVTDLGLAGER